MALMGRVSSSSHQGGIALQIVSPVLTHDLPVRKDCFRYS